MDKIRQEGRIVFRGDVPVAVIHPATLTSADGSTVVGPAGEARVHGDRLAALGAAGCLLPGTPDEVAHLSALLCDDRHSRTASYFCSVGTHCRSVIAAIRAIGEASVQIFGVGGIGSTVAMLLAGCGVQQLVLVDGDLVEESNLNRQLFYRRGDIGLPKVKALATVIAERFPEICVLQQFERITPDSLPSHLHGYSAVVFSADEPIGMSLLAARLAAEQGSLFVGAGYHFTRGRIDLGGELSRPSSGGSYRPLLDAVVQPSFGPSNYEIAGIVASQVALGLGGLRTTKSSEFQSWDTASFPRDRFLRG